MEVLETPWKVNNAIKRWMATPWVYLLFRLNGIPWKSKYRFYGIPIIQKHRGSRMSFGVGLQLRSSARSNPLGPNHPVILCTWQGGARLEVGSNFSMTGGTLCAATSIVIGNNVLVGANSTIADTDFHPLSYEKRVADPSAGKTAPIIIEDNVFIGMNSLILKGVTLGEGCVIGAGSVVTKNIPSKVVCAGNPVQVIRSLSS
jgi:acetyltransferase-like isoleucine patch superfamily enzyme